MKGKETLRELQNVKQSGLKAPFGLPITVAPAPPQSHTLADSEHRVYTHTHTHIQGRKWHMWRFFIPVPSSVVPSHFSPLPVFWHTLLHSPLFYGLENNWDDTAGDSPHQGRRGERRGCGEKKRETELGGESRGDGGRKRKGGGEGREKNPTWVFSCPLAELNKQRERAALTVTALDLWEFRALSARLINTSFSFNGAGTSPRAAFKSTLYLGHLALFLRAEPRGRWIQSTSHAASLCLPAGAPETGGKLIGLSGKNK